MVVCVRCVRCQMSEVGMGTDWMLLDLPSQPGGVSWPTGRWPRADQPRRDRWDTCVDRAVYIPR